MKAPSKKVARVALALIVVPLLIIAVTAAIAAEPAKTAAQKDQPCEKHTAPKTKAKKHKKLAKKAPASVAASPGTSGCVEISFTTKAEFGDAFVKFVTVGPDDRNLATNACTAIKKAGDKDFGPLPNECTSLLCDFSDVELVVGQKAQLMGSYHLTTHGKHILRLPAYLVSKGSKYVTAFRLMRGEVKYPDYPKQTVKNEAAYRAATEYGEKRELWLDNDSDAIGVRWFDYADTPNGKVAMVYYSKGEVPLDAAQLYWPWREWQGRRKVLSVPWR